MIMTDDIIRCIFHSLCFAAIPVFCPLFFFIADTINRARDGIKYACPDINIKPAIKKQT